MLDRIPSPAELAVFILMTLICTLIVALSPKHDAALFFAAVPLFFVSALLLSMYSGPLTAVTQDVVPPEVRALVVSITLLIGHFFGDVTSPLIVGAISDHLGGGAHGLSRALQVTCPIMLLCAGIVGLVGSRYVGRDLTRMEKERLAQADGNLTPDPSPSP